MNKLSQEEWDKYVSYVLANNPIDQRYRVFGILLEDFDFDYDKSDDPDFYAKMARRDRDLMQVKFTLSEISKQMYEKARRPIEEKT